MKGPSDDSKEPPKTVPGDSPQASFAFSAPRPPVRKSPPPDPRPSPPDPPLPPLAVRRLSPERAPASPRPAAADRSDAEPAASAVKVCTVSEIVGRAARLLDENFASVWIEGEIEGFKRHQVSGNCYLALKDTGARVEAMLRRQVAQSLSFPLRDGLKVRVRGRLTIYKEQGRFQLYIEEVVLSGEGELLLQFEELKARLAKEGLFAEARKRPLPKFPKVIGVATSQSGAALQDILKVATRRGRVQILVANCAVQGASAPPQIVQAIERLAPHVDVMIVGRGGGSVADLWCFNDEQVARAIHRCPVPVVSAVGHEVDFTIADFVADVRAPTPSAAAELCVPEHARLFRELGELSRRLLRAGRRLVDGGRQQIDQLLGRGQMAIERNLMQKRRTLGDLGKRLTACHPKTQLLRDQGQIDKLHSRLVAAMEKQTSERRQNLLSLTGSDDERLVRAVQRLLATKRQQFVGEVGKLEALSPLKVLTRGFAVARDAEGRVLRDSAAVTDGDSISVQLAQGALFCTVDSRSLPRSQNFEIPKSSKN